MTVSAPRVIHDRIDFENASAVMNAMAGHALNKEQEDYGKGGCGAMWSAPLVSVTPLTANEG